MKAWIARGITGLGAGLGKKDVLVVPRPNGNSLFVDFARGCVWLEDEEIPGQPSPDDLSDGPLEEIEVPEELVEKVNSSYDARIGELTQETEKLLSEFFASVHKG